MQYADVKESRGKEWAGTWNRNDEWTEEVFTSVHKNLLLWLPTVSDKWVFQLERGKETKRLHYQIYVETKERCTLNQLKSWSDVTCPGIYWGFCSSKGSEALKQYCQKSDTRVKGPWAADSVYIGQVPYRVPHNGV